MTWVGLSHVTHFGIVATPRRMIIVYVVCWLLLGVTLFWRNQWIRSIAAIAASTITVASAWYLVLPYLDLAACGCLAATVLIPLVARIPAFKRPAVT